MVSAGGRRPGKDLVAAGSRVAPERSVGEGDLETRRQRLSQPSCGPVVRCWPPAWLRSWVVVPVTLGKSLLP